MSFSATNLNCFGKITRAPKPGCLPLTEALGDKYYLDGSTFMNPQSTDWCPAWSVKVLKQAAPKGKPTAQPGKGQAKAKAKPKPAPVQCSDSNNNGRGR